MNFEILTSYCHLFIQNQLKFLTGWEERRVQKWLSLGPKVWLFLDSEAALGQDLKVNVTDSIMADNFNHGCIDNNTSIIVLALILGLRTPVILIKNVLIFQFNSGIRYWFGTDIWVRVRALLLPVRFVLICWYVLIPQRHYHDQYQYRYQYWVSTWISIGDQNRYWGWVLYSSS